MWIVCGKRMCASNLNIRNEKIGFWLITFSKNYFGASFLEHIVALDQSRHLRPFWGFVRKNLLLQACLGKNPSWTRWWILTRWLARLPWFLRRMCLNHMPVRLIGEQQCACRSSGIWYPGFYTGGDLLLVAPRWVDRAARPTAENGIVRIQRITRRVGIHDEVHHI